MTLTSKLLTTVAALSLAAGGAYAESHMNAAATDTQMSESADMNAQTGYPMGWNEDLDQRYADIADTPVRDLVGMNVVTDGGDDVGEIDTFVIVDGDLQAVVGVGGFLGIGEHDVALPLSDLTWDGRQMVIPFTADELEAMPEWTEEADYAALTETDTFRTRGEMSAEADANPQMAGTQIEDDPAAEEMAEAREGEIEQEVEEIAAETENAVEEGAAEAGQMAENAGEATMNAAEEAGDEVAEAAEATGDAIAEGAEGAEQMAENAAAEVGSWFEQLEAEFGDLADAEINEFEGKAIVTADGNEVGEIEDIAMQGQTPVAIVGVGGFLGLGEHDVALDLTRLSWNGESFVLDGYTEADLEQMPQVDPDSVELLEGDTTLRAHASM